jgi:tetratricopeptide (TPR) repeat protein
VAVSAWLGLGALTPAAAQKDGSIALYNNAMRFLQNGENDKAVDAFMQLLDLAKDSKDANAQSSLESVFYGLGAAHFNAKRYSEAAEKLGELLKRFPNSRLAPEVKFFIAQCFFFQDEFQKALDAFKVTETTPRYYEDSLLFQAECYRKLEKASEAAAPLERLAGDDVRSANSARATLQLAVLASAQSDSAKAVSLLTRLSRRLRLLPNVAAFNQAVILVGDALLQAGKAEESLATYRLLRDKKEVLELQSRQADQLQHLIASLRNRARQGTPDQATEILADAARREILLNEIKKSQEEYQKAPDTTPAILMRIGKAFYDGGKKWEAITAYDELLLRYPDVPERQDALFGLLVTYGEVKQYKQAQELADRFVTEFPQSERLEEVRYMKGVLALEGEDPEAAIRILTDLLAASPDTKYKQEVAYMIANAKFAMGQYPASRADYDAFLKSFPDSTLASEVAYRMTLCLVFDGKYEEAIKELNDFIVKNTDSPYLTDAKYRLMVCYFAAAVNDKSGKLYKQIITLTEQFEKEYPDSPQLGEVFALRGDSLAGLGDLAGQANQDDKAAEAYLQGFRVSDDFESQNYNLFEAIKLWQKHGDWVKIQTTLTEFVQAQPDHPSASTAKYWIGRALIKQRREPDAKQYYASEIKKFMTQPRRDAVEMMIRELTQLLGRKRRPAATTPPAAQTAAAQTPAVATAPAAEPPPSMTPEEELEALIGGEDTMKNRTSTARLFLARAMLAQVRNDTRTRDTYYDQLSGFEPNELSAYLLGQMAEYSIDKAETARFKSDLEASKTQLDRAEAFCKELLSSYPKSDFLEFAYVNQGEIAYARKNWAAAHQWFKEAIDVAGAVTKQKEAVFGQAKTLLEMERYPEAKKLFEQVASTREWRGEATPDSLFHLGEIEFRQGRFKEAIAYYQRVYAAYAKYPIPMARAYLQSARAFDKIGMRKEAVNSLGEMLRNEKIPQNYRDEARQLLKDWGAD